MIADNYGDPTTCLSEVQFFGVEKAVLDFFEKLQLQQYLKSFVVRVGLTTLTGYSVPS